MSKLSLTKKYATYPKYKDSGVEWLGEIPESWNAKKLQRLFVKVKRTGYLNEELLSVYRDHGVIPKSSRDDNFNKESDDLSTYQLVEIGDLAINKMKAWQGSLAVSDYRGIVSPAYYIAKPISEQHGRFLHYLLRSDIYIQQYQINSGGVRNNQWDLDYEQFRKIEAALPPKEEQEKIARFLDEQTARIDETIAKKERLIELLKEKRTATINHAVTKGLDPHVELVDSGIDWIGKIPKGWQVRPVKELFKISRGRVIAKTEIDMTKQYPVYSSQTKNDGVMGYIDTYDFDRSALTWTTDGANAGTVFYREGKFNCTNVCGVLTPKTEVELKYFVHSVQVSATPNKRLDTNGYKIMNNEMKNIFIVVPPAIEQKKIADFLSELSTKALSIETTLKKSITLLLELKSSLISHAVTGKIKV